MRVKILYDNQVVQPGVKSGWGFSCLINESVLFDTGEDAQALAYNMEKLKIDFSLIKHIVISHDHWDHAGGLWGLLKKITDPLVYVLPNFSKDFINKLQSIKVRVVLSLKKQSVITDVWTTGSQQGIYKDRIIFEQGLVVQSSSGLTLITGCAHPGIVQMVQSVRQNFKKDPLVILLGGFHLNHEAPKAVDDMVQTLESLGVRRVVPLHCTGNRARQCFQQVYQEHCVLAGAGSVVDL